MRISGKVRVATLSLSVFIVAFGALNLEAHKGIASKYNYNEDVFPILRDRCGVCHFEGGPAPMSLVSYLMAVPWAETIREVIIEQKMPPWYADPMGPAVKGGHTLPTKELDILLSWVVGGAPRANEKTFIFGDLRGVKTPTYDGPPAEWVGGEPDLVVEMRSAHTVPPGTTEDDAMFILSTGLKEELWVNMVDLLPGDRSMVREAIISLEDGLVLAAWVPGRQPIRTPSGTAFKLPAGAKLRLNIHYKKNWADEDVPKEDRSSVGLYFTGAPESKRSIATFSMTASTDNGQTGPQEATSFGGVLKPAARIVALRPSFDQAYASAAIDAVIPSGRRVPLLRLRAPHAQWYQRYWLEAPIDLPAGAKIEVTAMPARFEEFGSVAPERFRLGLDIDYVPNGIAEHQPVG